MTDIVFKLIPAYDKIIAYILGIKGSDTKQEKQKEIIDEFRKKWDNIKDKTLKKIVDYSGPLPSRIECFISTTCPKKGITNPLTIYLDRDIDKMVFSLVFHLNKISLQARKNLMDRIALTAIACNINQDIILNILALYNTIRIISRKSNENRLLLWIKTFMLGDTRKDLIVFEKIKNVLEEGLEQDIEQILDKIAKNCLNEIKNQNIRKQK